MPSEPTPVDLQQLIEQAPDAVIFADTDGRVRYWNAAAERIFGHAADDVLGQSLDIIVPEQFREAHWTGFDRALAGGETKYAGQALPTRSQRADGEQIYVELSFAILRGGDGEVIGALAHARDITARFTQDRETRRRLSDLEARLAELEGAGEEAG